MENQNLITVKMTKTQIELLVGFMESVRILNDMMGMGMHLEENEPIIELLNKAKKDYEKGTN